MTDIDGHDEMSTLDIDSTGAVVDPNRSHASALQGSDHGDGIRRITFDTESVCPRCHWRLTDSDVRAGWSWTQNDYCTTCPSCNNRFVPRFQVCFVRYFPLSFFFVCFSIITQIYLILASLFTRFCSFLG